MRTKVALLCLVLVGVPLAAPATTAYTRYVDYLPTWFPTVYVHTGESIDIQLEDGDVLVAGAIASDPRWHTGVVTGGVAPHVIVKPSQGFPVAQLLTIPTTKHEYHVLLRSGDQETSTYTLIFHEIAPRQVAVVSTPAPTPKAIAVSSCSPPLDSKYRVSGDKRIPVSAVCDDGQRTYILMHYARSMPATVPYRVDPGGHQDQIVNPGFNTVPDATGHLLGEWVLDGVFDHMALVADSSRGQIRKNIDRSAK